MVGRRRRLAEQVGTLVRLASDPALQRDASDSSEVWAPTHAWRALGQLRAEAAVGPLLALAKMIEWDEAADQELPVVFGIIGPAAIPYIGAFLANRENCESPVATAISGLTEIAARHGAPIPCAVLLHEHLGACGSSSHDALLHFPEAQGAASGVEDLPRLHSRSHSADLSQDIPSDQASHQG